MYRIIFLRLAAEPDYLGETGYPGEVGAFHKAAAGQVNPGLVVQCAEFLRHGGHDTACTMGEEPGKVKRARETSDLMWRSNNYKTIDCKCGTRLRIPPKFKAGSVRCPHYGRVTRL